MTVVNDGSVVLAGHTYGDYTREGQGLSDVVVVKINGSDGTVLWELQVGYWDRWEERVPGFRFGDSTMFS